MKPPCPTHPAHDIQKCAASNNRQSSSCTRHSAESGGQARSFANDCRCVRVASTTSNSLLPPPTVAPPQPSTSTTTEPAIPYAWDDLTNPALNKQDRTNIKRKITIARKKAEAEAAPAAAALSARLEPPPPKPKKSTKKAPRAVVAPSSIPPVQPQPAQPVQQRPAVVQAQTPRSVQGAQSTPQLNTAPVIPTGDNTTELAAPAEEPYTQEEKDMAALLLGML